MPLGYPSRVYCSLILLLNYFLFCILVKICEISLTTKQSVNLEKHLNSTEDLNNCEMAVLFIRLLPFMDKSAQEFSLNHICRLCVVNIRNKLKACKHYLLLNLIDLLNFHSKLNPASIEKIFRTIQILGRCSMGQQELRKLFELLQPKTQFPYGTHIIRCFTSWAKYSTGSVGLNLGLFTNNAQSSDATSSNENLSSTSFTASNNATNSLMLQNENSLLPGFSTSSEALKTKKTSVITINQSMLVNMMRTTGTGALSANAQQQAKYFFDFQHSNSVI